MEYVNYIKSKARISKSPPVSHTPVLTDDDEAFLHRVASQDESAPTTGRDAQIALMDGAQNIPLPEEPGEREDLLSPDVITETSGSRGGAKSPKGKTRRPWTWLADTETRKRKENMAQDLSNVAAGLKGTGSKPDETAAGGEEAEKEEEEKEQEDLNAVLEQLNLAAVNNRVFSISDETQELLRKFKLVLKDLVNGVPTAYKDLESLLTNGDKELQKAFTRMPTFLQKLVEQLPDKVTQHLGPEIMAAAAERAEQSGVNKENAGKAASAAKKMGIKVPSLKELVGKPAALAGMLRSIVSYLKVRFPAIMGMNVLWSLALFLLLIVLWYCHKRGREVRLEKERLLTEQEIAHLEAEYAARDPSETLTTTAPENASIEEVEAGVREAQHARQAALSKCDRTPSPNSEARDEKRRPSIEVYPGT